MTPPSTVELARLRKRPQQARLYLAIFQPQVVLACQINDASIVKGAISITYDGVTAGSDVFIENGMTMYVGSYPNGKDIGRIRVRSATSTVITVAENDHIPWADNLYLTVVKFFEPWGIYNRIVLDADNVPTFYKDYDIAYTDQNQIFDPVVHMGPNFAGFVETGAFSARFSASGSFDPTDGSTPTGFAWWFEGAVATGAFGQDPAPAQWTQPGQYTVHLTATTDKGKSTHAHRHITVLRRPGDAGSGPKPSNDWGIRSFGGARAQHGWSVDLWVREQADVDQIVSGALVVIFADVRYGDDEDMGPDKAIGGEAVARQSLLFAGYIKEESISYDYETSRLEFKAESVTNIFENKHTFSVSLESETNAMTWYQIRDMTVDKAMIHYLMWHSTLLNIADFNPTNDSKQVEFMDFGRGSVMEAVYELYNSTLFAEVVSDRQGSVWAEIQANMVPTGSRAAAIPVNMKIAKADWLGGIEIRRITNKPTAYVELGGISYNGPVTGTNVPYLSGAPGDVPNYEGKVNTLSGLVISDQVEINVLSGLYYSDSNAQYPEVTLVLAGLYSNIDIAPQEYLIMDLAQADTWRNLVWINKRFLPHTVSLEYNPKYETLIPSITLKEETWSDPGDTIIIPVEAPFDELSLPEWDLEFPPFPPLPPLFPPITPPPTNGDLVYGIFNNVLCRTRDFFSAVSPTWEAVSGFTGTVLPTYLHFYLDYAAPHNIAYCWSKYDDGGGNGPVGWYTADLNATGTTHWTKFWGSTESDLYLGLNTQRTIGYADILPALSHHVLWAGRALLGQPAQFLRGSPFSWANYSAPNTYPNPDDGIIISPHLGGSTFLTFSNNSVFRSDNGGSGWITNGSIGQLVNAWPIGFGGGVIWASDEYQAGLPELLFDPLGWASGLTQARISRVSPIYAGVKWSFSRAPNASGWHAVNPVRVINGILYAFMEPVTGGFGDRTILMRTTDMASWQILLDHPNGIAPLEVLPTNTAKMCSYSRVALVGKVLGSQDGGYTWVDKTGNLASVAGVLGTGSLRGGLKFAWTF